MTKLSYFTAIIMLAFMLAPKEINAQEIETDLPQLYELPLYYPTVDENAPEPENPDNGLDLYIYIPVGQVTYADPETWTNNNYFGLGFRLADIYTATGIFFDYELGFTNSATSDLDGLRRNSGYEKFSMGVLVNQNQSGTTLFFGLGFGLINVSHSVEGKAAWRAPESDEVYETRIIYQNYTPLLPIILLGGVPANTGAFLHAEIGLKIKNRHSLSFYFQPIDEGTLSARNDTYYDTAYEQQNDNYYYGEIPDKIVESMAGFHYSYIFGSSSPKAVP